MKSLLFALALLPTAALADADPAAVAAIEQCLAANAEIDTARDCIFVMADACIEEPDGQTTVGMMFCAMAETDAWDVHLNRVYQWARGRAAEMDRQDATNFPQYAVRAEQLRDAQRAWIAFRDANCAAAHGIYGAGSMRQIVGARCRLQMTAERTLELRGAYDIGF